MNSRYKFLFSTNFLCFYIEKYFPDSNSTESSVPLKDSECEFLLGILTVPGNNKLRNTSRNTWIKDLPKKVCYKFLYDKTKYISSEEKFDGISLNSKHEGKGIRFGEKLYKFFTYVQNNEKYQNVRYVVKMDDDVVLCPERLFPFLENHNLNSRTYAGWFHHIDMDLGFHHRADEMFIILGRVLMSRIVSKRYCQHRNQKTCDSLGHIFDTNYGGTSLGLWLSKMNDVNELHLNGYVEELRNSEISLNTKDALLYHPTKTVEKMQEKYLKC